MDQIHLVNDLPSLPSSSPGPPPKRFIPHYSRRPVNRFSRHHSRRPPKIFTNPRQAVLNGVKDPTVNNNPWRLLPHETIESMKKYARPDCQSCNGGIYRDEVCDRCGGHGYIGFIHPEGCKC